jgi:hypothetical protein
MAALPNKDLINSNKHSHLMQKWILPHPLTPSPNSNRGYAIENFVWRGEKIERGRRPLTVALLPY